MKNFWDIVMSDGNKPAVGNCSILICIQHFFHLRPWVLPCCRIYAERQSLNMQVMAQLMAAQQNAAGPSSQGSLPECAQKLREKLNQLLSNLREEQRLESEHHHDIFRNILTPLQVCWASLCIGWTYWYQSCYCGIHCAWFSLGLLKPSGIISLFSRATNLVWPSYPCFAR